MKGIRDMNATLHFDGSCWPNPGPNARGGFILAIAGGPTIEHCIVFGQGTNNTAEYMALIAGLRAALAAGVSELDVYGDSQLVIYGVQRMRPAKKGKPHLEILKAEAIELARQFAKIAFNWVPRESNAGADAVADRIPAQ